MLRCHSCSAPLKPSNANCSYCGTRNRLDLQSKRGVKHKGQATRTCPECQCHLQCIELPLEPAIEIDQCPRCFGLFFDHGELDEFMQQQGKPSEHVDLTRLDNINKDHYKRNTEVRYRRCPVCEKMMARRGYAYRSGVIIDECRQHGIWLDNGELAHLQEWQQHGGQVVANKRQARLNQQASQRSAPKRPLIYENEARFNDLFSYGSTKNTAQDSTWGRFFEKVLDFLLP